MRPRVFVFVRRGLWRVSREDFPLTPDPSPPRGGEGRIGCQWAVSVAGCEVIIGQTWSLIFAASREESHCCSGGGLQDRAA